MHLLVLSAFRPVAMLGLGLAAGLNAPFGAQCFPTPREWMRSTKDMRVSMHLLVLSAFRPEEWWSNVIENMVSMHLLVLSAFRPSGAAAQHPTSHVSMHLLVLSAFRRWEQLGVCLACWGVSMHLLVLSAFRQGRTGGQGPTEPVSMHLLVLSAFRPPRSASSRRCGWSQCTFWCSVLSDMAASAACRAAAFRLNAPFGAQCFPTWEREICGDMPCVSMHLLVLSAFRQGRTGGQGPTEPVSMHLLVLSAFRPPRSASSRRCGWSQCTFWCSVLSDMAASAACRAAAFRLNAPFGAQCFPTWEREICGDMPCVSMHLLVLSAFRLQLSTVARIPTRSVSMHLLVLSAFRL